MQNYISVKMVKAEPCKAWKDFKGHKEGDEGYIFAQIYNLLTFLLQSAKNGFKGDK